MAQNRVQILRSSTPGNIPAAGARQPGELWVNFADRQIGYIDASQVAQKTQAVRFFSTVATYVPGDFVWNAGNLYAANTNVSPGAFNPGQWTLIGGANAAYLPLGGGTLTGPLTTQNLTAQGVVNLSPVGANVSLSPTGSGLVNIMPQATTGYMDNMAIGARVPAAATFTTMTATGTATFTDIKTTTLEASGAVSIGGTLTGAGAAFNGEITVGGAVTTRGATSGAFLYDRGNNGGNTGQCVGLFRDGNSGVLYMDPAGSVATIDANGNIGFQHVLTAGTLSSNGYLYAYGPSNLTGPVGITGVASSYPLNLNEPASQHCVISYTVNGVRQILSGVWNDGSWRCYDASAGAHRLSIDYNGNVTVAQQANHLIAGANALWETAAAAVFSPFSGGTAAASFYGGAGSSGWASYNRVDNWPIYNMLVVFGTTACGSITSNGTNAFFNTTCDARRKDNIRDLVPEVDVGGIIDALKPVIFDWKPIEFTTLGEAAVEDIDGKITKAATKGKLVRIESHTDHGFVAQDLYEVLPNIVHKPENDDELMMADYSKMLPYVIAELQHLRQRVAQLEGAAA